MAKKFVHDNKEKTSKKGLIITSSIIGGLIVIAGIVLATLFGLGYFENDNEKTIYFKDLANHKLNTVEVLNKVEDKEHVFLFVYNNDEFNTILNDTEDTYSEEDKDQLNKTIEQIANLAETIETKNESVGRELFFLYIVDTSIAGNETIYNNSSYGSITEEEDPALQYYFDGTLSDTVPEDVEKRLDGKITDYDITYKGSNKKLLNAAIRDAKEFIIDIKY